jgi:hypothetical protein
MQCLFQKPPTEECWWSKKTALAPQHEPKPLPIGDIEDCQPSCPYCTKTPLGQVVKCIDCLEVEETPSETLERLLLRGDSDSDEELRSQDDTVDVLITCIRRVYMKLALQELQDGIDSYNDLLMNAAENCMFRRYPASHREWLLLKKAGPLPRRLQDKVSSAVRAAYKWYEEELVKQKNPVGSSLPSK